MRINHRRLHIFVAQQCLYGPDLVALLEQMRRKAMPKGVCAMKLMDGMGGNPRGFYQGTPEPLGLSRVGRSTLVRSMPLQGTGEARGKPPRCPAWLRDRQVSSHEADFDRRGTAPLSQDVA